MATRKSIFSVLLILLLTLTLTSCAPKPDILSEEEIEKQRETYPVVADTFSSDSITYEMVLDYTVGVAVVTVTKDHFSAYDKTYLPVQIDELLYNDGSFTEGDKLDLCFGTSSLIHSSINDYHTGERYLCFITHTSRNQNDNPLYSISKQCTAYVTEDNHILYMVKNGLFSDYNGYSLDSYKTALESIMK